MLIAQNRYFGDLVEANPLMSALEPTSGLLGKEYAKEAEAESDHHLHVRATGARGRVLSKDSGASAWRPSTGGLCAPPGAQRTTRDRSRACSAPRNDS